MESSNQPAPRSAAEDRERDVFLHDLKNVMTGALGHLSLIRRKVGDRAGVSGPLQTVENILRGACRMAEGALDPSAPGEGGPVSVIDVAGACAGICVPPDRAELRITHEDEIPLARADETGLRRVFNNLLTNAVQALDGKGGIEVRIERYRPDRRETDPRMLVATVADDGPGIPEHLRERVFERGFSTREGGNGVGLASVREWLASIGGDISLDCPPEGGSRFRVRLPAADGIDPRSKVPAPVRAGKAGRVLVLDDEPMVLEILGEMLPYLGFEVVATTNGLETVRRYEEALLAGEPFDRVILDLIVPGGLAGAEAAEKLRRIDPGARLYISSGQRSGPLMTAPAEHGFAGSLKKPYSLEELADILKE